ncbi:hypothetical protein RV16_GL000214 [Enterococcus saccharolyticus]|nr:hypothetical protein RV16_GL000214 [Enterococcus saccharolyticus]
MKKICKRMKWETIPFFLHKFFCDSKKNLNIQMVVPISFLFYA